MSENTNINPAVLMLNGPPRSGKDSIANIMRDTLSNVFVYSLADPLKHAVHCTFDVPDKSLKAYELVKDEVNEDFLGDTPRQAYIKFSESYMKPNYGKEVWAKIAIRKITQDLKNYNFENIRPVILITDVGFREEVTTFARTYGANNCTLIQLTRDGKSFINDSRNYVEHPKVSLIDIHNQEGKLENTAARVKDIIQKISMGVSSNEPQETED